MIIKISKLANKQVDTIDSIIKKLNELNKINRLMLEELIQQEINYEQYKK